MTTIKKFNSITEIEERYDLIFNETDLLFKNQILDIFNEKSKFILSENKLLEISDGICITNDRLYNGVIMNILGMYHCHVNVNTDLMIKYYEKAIEFGNSDSYCNLGNYYEDEKDYSKAEHYYVNAVEKNDLDALWFLGEMYYDLGFYDDSKQCFVKGIINNDVEALNSLKEYVEKEELYAILSQLKKNNNNDLISNALKELKELSGSDESDESDGEKN